MEKPHLYEPILLLKRDIDEAVHGLEPLKRVKDSRFAPECFDERRVLFEEQRARLNAYFCSVVEQGEELDADRLERQYGEYRKSVLDEVQVYRDVVTVEQQRQADGKRPRVRFLCPDEQRDGEKPTPAIV